MSMTFVCYDVFCFVVCVGFVLCGGFVLCVWSRAHSR